MEACDALDGVQDGLIIDQRQCNARFDPASAAVGGAPLRRTDGADTGDACLSNAQIRALNAMNMDTIFNFKLASGETRYPGYPGYHVWGADLGITSNPSLVQPVVAFLGLGTTAPSMPMPRSAPYISVLVDQWIKYSITRDAGLNLLLLDPENPGPYAARISDLSRQLGTSCEVLLDMGRCCPRPKINFSE